MELVREAPPSVLILGQTLGTQAVLDCLVWLQAANRPTSVIILGDKLGEAEAVRFVQAGAKGIVRKTADLEMLSICLRSVAAGAFWSQMEAFRVPQMASHETSAALTPRDREVLKLVAQGLKNREIGLELGICLNTVKMHLKHICEKTAIRSPPRPWSFAIGGCWRWLSGPGSARERQLKPAVGNTA